MILGFTVNGHTYEWGDMTVAATGISIEGVTSVSYDHGVDPQDVSGAGFEPKDYTKGQYSAKDVEVEMLQAYWDAWRNSLGKGYMRQRQTFTVSYADDDEEVTTDTLLDASIKNVKKNPKKGSEPLTVTISLKVRKILEGGLDPVNAS